MICRDFPLLYSAQVDGHATEHDQVALQRHLRECAICRRSAAEMRSLRANLRTLAAPLPAPELTGQIQNRLRQEAAARARGRAVLIPGGGISWSDVRRFWFNSFANWLVGTKAKIFSQGIGAIVSLPLFILMVPQAFKGAQVVAEAFKQDHLTLTQTVLSPPPAPPVIFQYQSDVASRYQARLKAALIYPPPPPSLNMNSEFQVVAARLIEEDVLLTAEIGKDGGAAKVTYYVPPNDPLVQESLSTAMSQRGIFQGIKPNQNTSSIAVVYLSSITTTGRL
jgi:anti-sigma factor RsiW